LKSKVTYNQFKNHTSATLSELGQKLNFKFTWRDYQGKFLHHFQEHIRDDHLHVVAPPGSGKTILGLEIVKRVGRTTLVLTPTLTIRNQWQSRLETFFLQENSFDDYTLDIKKPKQLTFSTYQSLFSLDKSLHKKEESLVAFIRKHGITVIVLDEAHHLKNAWWKSLFKLKQIGGITVISLTATPPYDSSIQELQKYFDLCGPIDDEIAVPDLVKNGDLCPHQDFVYFSKPSEAQIKYIITYRERILNFINELVQNGDFQNLLLKHQLYAETEASLAEVYKNPSFFSSILIFLNAAGFTIDFEKLKVLGFDDKKIEFPSLTHEWLEILLQELLVAQREVLLAHEPMLHDIEKRLSRIGGFEKKRVNFIGHEDLYRSLASSPSKLESIAAILKAEKANLADTLKAVVLTDFIRKGFLDFTGTDTTILNKLGVVSIFQYLRTILDFKQDIGVLSGSLVIIHESIIPSFEEHIKNHSFNYTKLRGDSEFVMISSFGSDKNSIVATMTALFELGIIKVLIGTKALLGEGWDAPAMNTLVLASYVGSFVSSNQMRGRAIRVDANQPDKTGNIWHLACIDPTVEDGGRDIEKLFRRFEAFSGVSSYGKTYIESGMERLHLPTVFSSDMDLGLLNNEVIELAGKRSKLKNRWFDAIQKGNVLTREIKLPYLGKKPYREEKSLRWGNAAKFLSLELVTGVGFFLPEFLAKNAGLLLERGVLLFIYAALSAIMMLFAPKAYKAITLYYMFGNTYRKTKKIAKAIFLALNHVKEFNTPFPELSVQTHHEKGGTFICYLKGASNAESSLFVNLLAEVLEPIKNPRYLLTYRHPLKRHWGMRNYFVVPSYFGKRKADAQLFHKFWKQHVDGSKLLYTRTKQGRKELLKARLSHIIYQFKDIPKKSITWK